MISKNKRVLYGEVYNDIRCLSTDEKPTDGIKNGSTLVEIDTGRVYLFDIVGHEWNEVPTGGGGGGGGGGDGVESFNGRRGAVRSRTGDYTAAQIGTSTAGRSVQDVLDGLQPDTALSTTSTNPVENRAISEKIAEIEATAQIDAALSPTSQRPVRNSAISAKFSEHASKLVPAGGDAGAILAKRTGSDHSLEWKSADEWMLTADYDPDKDGSVNEADLAGSLKAGTHTATITEKGRDLSILTDYDKGAANGVAPLDPSKKILPEYLPDSIMAGLTYGGVFNATTRVVELTPAAKSILDVTADTMTLENSSQIPEGYPANAELFYITTTGGTFADMTFASGDWLISLSTSWKQMRAGNQVASVNAKTGAVVLDSDDITQGVVNLYMRTTERAKLADIETRATRDINVVQYATIETDENDKDWLVLTNKNGAVTRFLGGDSDLTDYLEKTGNASQTYTNYVPAVSRQPFSGNETASAFNAKVAGWLNALETIAFTGSYDDLTDKPTYNGVDVEGALTAKKLGTLDVREVNALPASPVENTLYVFHTTKRGEPYTRYTIYIDGDWQDIETGGFEVIGINADPNNTPPTSDAIYVYHWTDGDSVARRQVGIMLDGTYTIVALPEDIITSYEDLDDKPEIDGNEVVSGDQTHESLGLVGVDDFVTTESGKTEGIEIVLPAGTPSSPIVLSEINDTEEMRYSGVHTSSNQYINNQIDALNDALAGKLNLLFVEELPEHPTRNTQYYVETDTEGTFDIWIVDSVGEMHNAGTTEIDMDGLVRDTRRIAGLRLDADITAAQLEDALKAVAAQLSNKIISADDNTIIDIATDNLKSTALSTAIDSSAPLDTKLTTEKAVVDYAVKKSTLGPYVYGTASGGAAMNYLVKLSIDVAATSSTVPTAKAVYDYSVPKTTGANVVYGTSSTGTAQNLDRVTSISSSSNNDQIPTAKAVYNFAVPQTNTGNRIYGTNSSGGETQYPFSDTYNSTASNQLFTRAGAYNLYSAVRNGEQAMVFCGNVTRNSSQSLSSTTAVKILLTGSDIYRSNLIQLASNGIKILVAGTYWFRFVARLADTAGATRHWYLGGGINSMADDQEGGSWNYTYFRHKAEATYLHYCTANQVVNPFVYIDGSSGTLNYTTVEVFRLNNK